VANYVPEKDLLSFPEHGDSLSRPYSHDLRSSDRLSYLKLTVLGAAWLYQ